MNNRSGEPSCPHHYKCIGVFREDDHSPERVSDDRAILEAVASILSGIEGMDVSTVLPGELAGVIKRCRPDIIFYMCEESSRLDMLASSGADIVVNPVQGVKNTFRANICRIFSKETFFPESIMTATGSGNIPFNMSGNVWVKRGDYHAVELADVQFAATRRELDSILSEFRERGIEDVMLQRHVEGDLIKFYGVADRWFHWFYHREQQLERYAFDNEKLRERCRYAARLVDVEVYGGDAIVSPDGAIYIIDLNAWPSFALFRQEAAGHIAAHILSKLNLSTPCSQTR